MQHATIKIHFPKTYIQTPTTTRETISIASDASAEGNTTAQATVIDENNTLRVHTTTKEYGTAPHGETMAVATGIRNLKAEVHTVYWMVDAQAVIDLLIRLKKKHRHQALKTPLAIQLLELMQAIADHPQKLTLYIIKVESHTMCLLNAYADQAAKYALKNSTTRTTQNKTRHALILLPPESKTKNIQKISQQTEED